MNSLRLHGIIGATYYFFFKYFYKFSQACRTDGIRCYATCMGIFEYPFIFFSASGTEEPEPEAGDYSSE